MSIIICGGGIIGLSTAFYLKKLDPNVSVTVIEKVSVASQASGKAGGFLAKNWNSHDKDLDKLTQLSFRLHQELKEELNCDVGYRNLTTFSSTVDLDALAKCKLPTKSPTWIYSAPKTQPNVIGTPKDTAQVHPELLTRALSKDVDIKIGNVEGIGLNNDGSVRCVHVDGKSISASKIVIALGPWTKYAASWFPNARSHFNFYADRVHSVVFEAETPAESIFLDYTVNNEDRDLEIYPRPDGTVYSCGYGDKEPLPEDPANVTKNEKSCEKLSRVVQSVCPILKTSKLLKTQACYVPFSKDTKPVIGPIPGHPGAFVASGHGVWGILNAPATGLCMASLLLDKELPVDIKAFQMSRFT